MTTEGQTLHPALVEAMQLDRDSLNQRFKFASRQKRIDSQSFLEHLAARVNPIVAAVHETLPERSRIVTRDLYRVSLDLFGAAVLGADTELPILDRLWRELLPRIPQLVARDPHRVTGSLCNALLQIYRQTTQGAENWLNKFTVLAPQCLSPQQLLDAGKVLSWTCGMAQYRIAALELSRQMDHELLVGIFQMSDTTTTEHISRLLDQSQRNPWQSLLTNSRETDNTVRQVAIVGAFRGFGGAFLTPPTVRLESGNLLVQDAESIWHLFADNFGSYLYRVGESNGRKSRRKATGKDDVSISRKGTVSWCGRSYEFPHLADTTSAAFDGVTLAVTIPDSFHVTLLADHH